MVSSDNLRVCYWKLPVEIVDLPIKDGDFPVCYVSLPEGISIVYVDVVYDPAICWYMLILYSVYIYTLTIVYVDIDDGICIVYDVHNPYRLMMMVYL